MKPFEDEDEDEDEAEEASIGLKPNNNASPTTQ